MEGLAEGGGGAEVAGGREGGRGGAGEVKGGWGTVWGRGGGEGCGAGTRHGGFVWPLGFSGLSLLARPFCCGLSQAWPTWRWDGVAGMIWYGSSEVH